MMNMREMINEQQHQRREERLKREEDQGGGKGDQVQDGREGKEEEGRKREKEEDKEETKEGNEKGQRETRQEKEKIEEKGATSTSTSTSSKDKLIKSFVPREILGPMVLEALDGFMFLLDKQGEIVLVSENIEQHLGIGQDSVEGASIYSLMHPLDREKFTSSVLTDLQGPGSKVVTCRLANKIRRRRELQGDELDCYECFQISHVPVQPQMLLVNNVGGRDLTTCKRFCVARMLGDQEIAQYVPVEMLTTRLDCVPGQHKILAVDTTGLNSQHTADITTYFLEKPFADLAHPKDRSIVEDHLSCCMNEEGESISPYYRLKFLGGDRGCYLKVRSRSMFFRPCPEMNNSVGYVNATHSVLNLAELGIPPPTPLEVFEPNASSAITNSSSSSNNNNIITTKSTTSPSDSSSSSDSAKSTKADALQKNLLLKQLLNVNFDRTGDSSSSKRKTSLLDLAPISPATSTGSSSSNTSRILQLLSQHAENVPRLPTGSPSSTGSVGVKRSASGSPLPPPSTSSDTSSPVCKQNPSLTNLLAKPPHNSVAVPPPVPTKWHQEPREKLPKGEEGLKKFLPPHPAERAGNASHQAQDIPTTSNQVLHTRGSAGITAAPSSFATSAAPIAPTPSGSQMPEEALNTDAVLSEILEGVIDIQEKNPIGPKPGPNISEIEKYLASSDTTASRNGGGNSGNSSHQFPQQRGAPHPGQSPSSGTFGPAPIQTTASSQSGSINVASNNQQLRHKAPSSSSPPSGSAGTIVPRMNELLQVVPPNVSIPDCPDLDNIVMIQQRRRMSSGGGSNTSGPPPNRIPRTSSAIVSPVGSNQPSQQTNNQLLMQQLNAGPMNSQRPQQPQQQQHYGTNFNTDYRMQRMSFPPSSLQQQGSLLQQNPPPSLGPSVRQPHLPQQQQRMMGSNNFIPQQQQQHFRPSVATSARSSSRGGEGPNAGSEENRSLLQQLLSE